MAPAWHINWFWIALSFGVDPTQVELLEQSLCAESENWLFTWFRRRCENVLGEKKGFGEETSGPMVGHFWLPLLSCGQHRLFPMFTADFEEVSVLSP